MHNEKPIKSMRVSSSHKRSKRNPGKRQDILDIFHETPYHLKLDMGQLKGCNELTKKKHSPEMEQSSLKRQEISQLENRLQDQFVVRGAPEEVPGLRFSINNNLDKRSMPK